MGGLVLGGVGAKDGGSSEGLVVETIRGWRQRVEEMQRQTGGMKPWWWVERRGDEGGGEAVEGSGCQKEEKWGISSSNQQTQHKGWAKNTRKNESNK